MTETIFVDHTPNTYKAYKTIGGWSIMFLDKDGNSRPADMAKTYKNRQNAYARVKTLNHPIAKAIKKTGICEAYTDGYTLSVREDENENSENVYTLSFQSGGMPPYFQRDFKTVAEAEAYIRDETHFSLYLDWRKIEGE